MSVAQELEIIKQQDPSRTLYPEAIVEFAQNPKTALHSRFEWDDSIAGANYRLLQARNIIRVSVTVLNRGDGQEVPIRTWVSMSSEAGGADGYVETKIVLANRSKRKRLVFALLHRMVSILNLHPLPELDAVRKAIETTRNNLDARATNEKKPHKQAAE